MINCGLQKNLTLTDHIKYTDHAIKEKIYPFIGYCIIGNRVITITRASP